MGRYVAYIAAGLAVVAGLFCAGFGLWLAVYSPRASDRASAAAAQLPVITNAAQLAGTPAGRRVLVEGRIAPGNPGLDLTNDRGATRHFVIYRRTRFERKPPGRNGVQVVNHIDDKPVTPALTIALPDGAVRVVNDDYRYAFPLGNGISPTPDTRVIGFVEGDEALVDGAIVPGPDGPALQARFIHGGGRQRYIDQLRGDPSSRGLATGFGQLLICLALPALSIGFVGIIVTWSLARRRAAPPATTSPTIG